MKRKEAYEALKPKLTQEFLDTLVLAVRTIGWHEISDLVEADNLINVLYEFAEREPPTEFKLLRFDDDEE